MNRTVTACAVLDVFQTDLSSSEIEGELKTIFELINILTVSPSILAVISCLRNRFRYNAHDTTDPFSSVKVNR